MRQKSPVLVLDRTASTDRQAPHPRIDECVCAFLRRKRWEKRACTRGGRRQIQSHSRAWHRCRGAFLAPTRWRTVFHLCASKSDSEATPITPSGVPSGGASLPNRRPPKNESLTRSESRPAVATVRVFGWDWKTSDLSKKQYSANSSSQAQRI